MAFVIIDDPVGGASTTLRCGQNNTAPAGYSGVLAGRCNTASGSYSIIGGGFKNTTNASYSSIFAGSSNFILTSTNSSIGSGVSNTISSGKYNNIVGGSLNKILLNGSYSFIGGGGQNTTDALYSTITAGRENTISCTQSVLSTYSIVNGGYLNKILGSQSSNIDGGTSNLIRKVNGSPNNNVIDGGGSNTIIDQNYSNIGGGNNNLLQGVGSWNLIAGGRGNNIVDVSQTTSYSNIGGGTLNSIQGSFSVIAGGDSNTIDSERSAILGGSTNTIDNTGNWNAIVGGKGNTISGNNSMIFSSASILTADNSVILGGNNITGTQNDTVYVPNLNIQILGVGTPVNNLGIDGSGNIVVGSTPQDVFVTGGTLDYTTGELTLDNNNATQVVIGGFHDYYLTGLTFNNSNFILSAQMNDGNTYVADLSILASDMTVTGGTYNPITGTATFTTNSGNTFNVTGFLTGYTDIFLTGASYNSGTGVLTLTNTDGSTVTATGFSTGGGSGVMIAGTGANSVLRGCNSNVASAGWATVSGGLQNSSTGLYTTIGGGRCNTIVSTSNLSVIGGGEQNNILDCSTFGSTNSTISGGKSNTILQANSLIGGGNSNFSAGEGSVIVGGVLNKMFPIVGNNYNLNRCSFIGGGSCNYLGDGISAGGGSYVNIVGGFKNQVLSSDFASILGGCCNTASALYGVIAGGRKNTTYACCSTIINGFTNGIDVCNLYSAILGGSCNKIGNPDIPFLVHTSQYNTIVNGNQNNIPIYCSCVVIAGSNITADRSCTTFVNNLSIKNIPTSTVGLPAGSVWRDANGFLKIV